MFDNNSLQHPLFWPASISRRDGFSLEPQNERSSRADSPPRLSKRIYLYIWMDGHGVTDDPPPLEDDEGGGSDVLTE